VTKSKHSHSHEEPSHDHEAEEKKDLVVEETLRSHFGSVTRLSREEISAEESLRDIHTEKVWKITWQEHSALIYASDGFKFTCKDESLKGRVEKVVYYLQCILEDVFVL
jgi:hypothetical protein